MQNIKIQKNILYVQSSAIPIKNISHLEISVTESFENYIFEDTTYEVGGRWTLEDTFKYYSESDGLIYEEKDTQYSNKEDIPLLNAITARYKEIDIGYTGDSRTYFVHFEILIFTKYKDSKSFTHTEKITDRVTNRKENILKLKDKIFLMYSENIFNSTKTHKTMI